VVHTSVLHGYKDLELQRFGGYDLDLLGSRDFVCHVTIGLAIAGFLWVVYYNHTSILHLYGDIMALK